MSNVVTFVGHIGLGDLVLMSGIGVWLTDIYDRVYFPARKSDAASLNTFFLNHPRIELYWPDAKPGLDPYSYPVEGDVILTGIYKYNPPLHVNQNLSFIENYYKQACIPFSVRWDDCPLQVSSYYVEQIEPPQGEYEFIHHCPERGHALRSDILTRIKNPVFVEVDGSKSILRYAKIIENANKIHCVDSCFLHLVESLGTHAEAYYYHKYAKPLEQRFNDVDAPARKLWEVIL